MILYFGFFTLKLFNSNCIIAYIMTVNIRLTSYMLIEVNHCYITVKINNNKTKNRKRKLNESRM